MISCRWVAHDLKDNSNALVYQKLIPAGLDPKLPTLIVLECVQMYLPTAAADQLGAALSTICSDCHLCSYEPILGSDSFGTVKVMGGRLWLLREA